MEQIFDSHAHYDDDAFLEDKDLLLKQLLSTEVCGIVNVGASMETSKKSIEIANNYENVWATVGVHPECLEGLTDDFTDELYKMIKDNKKVVAIGEIGLDYHFDKENSEKQKEMFERQLKLALDTNMPVVIHSRDAHMDTMDILKKYNPKGIVHCFSGSVETAKEIVNMGMYIGIGGAVTFKNAKNRLKVAEYVPLSSLVLETDAPYMTPEPFRGKRCDSSHIKYTAQKIADVKGISVDEVLLAAKENAFRVYNLEEKR